MSHHGHACESHQPDILLKPWLIMLLFGLVQHHQLLDEKNEGLFLGMFWFCCMQPSCSVPVAAAFACTAVWAAAAAADAYAYAYALLPG